MAAEVLWPYNSGAEVARLTGINRFALYKRAKAKGWPPKRLTVRPDRLLRIKKDWENPKLTVREVGARNRIHFTRPGQLAVLHGWKPRKRGKPVSVKVRGEDGRVEIRTLDRM